MPGCTDTGPRPDEGAVRAECDAAHAVLEAMPATAQERLDIEGVAAVLTWALGEDELTYESQTYPTGVAIEETLFWLHRWGEDIQKHPETVDHSQVPWYAGANRAVIWLRGLGEAPIPAHIRHSGAR